MPIVEVHVIEGYDADARFRLGQALTAAVRTVVPAPPDAITVMFNVLDTASYMRGGQTRTPAPALPDPAGIVRAYLDAMEARDLDAARAMLGDGFSMTFPSGKVMTDPQELVDWSRDRYRNVRKTYAAFDVAPGLDTTVVHCHGTLTGEWPDGTGFDGVRFTDRFELRADKIVDQQVWNDLSEASR